MASPQLCHPGVANISAAPGVQGSEVDVSGRPEKLYGFSGEPSQIVLPYRAVLGQENPAGAWARFLFSLQGLALSYLLDWCPSGELYHMTLSYCYRSVSFARHILKLKAAMETHFEVIFVWHRRVLVSDRQKGMAPDLIDVPRASRTGKGDYRGKVAVPQSLRHLVAAGRHSYLLAVAYICQKMRSQHETEDWPSLVY